MLTDSVVLFLSAGILIYVVWSFSLGSHWSRIAMVIGSSCLIFATNWVHVIVTRVIGDAWDWERIKFFLRGVSFGVVISIWLASYVPTGKRKSERGSGVKSRH